jgi:hypothetical protein
MPGRIIKTKEDVDGWVDVIKGQPLPLTVSFTRGEKRTNPQNNTIHMWYGEIASQLGDTTSIEVRAECKLIFGVPILRRDDDVFRVDYDRDFRPFQYETKLRLFRLLDPCNHIADEGATVARIHGRNAAPLRSDRGAPD